MGDKPQRLFDFIVVWGVKNWAQQAHFSENYLSIEYIPGAKLPKLSPQQFRFLDMYAKD